MDIKDFKLIATRQFENCKEVLLFKNVEYAKSDDVLSNLKTAAKLQNVSVEKALAGMMAKHTVSIYDMCYSSYQYTMETWNEKITDHINYLVLLKAIVSEQIGEGIVND